MQLLQPFYDPLKSYDDNCKYGPFGAFADGQVVASPKTFKYSFFGFPLDIPFGIPAGPVPNANFCKGAFEKCYSIVVYKTVRTSFHSCHPFPNILPIKTNGTLSIEDAQNGMIVDSDFHDPIAITNSFGVPSFEPSIWQPDMKKAIEMTREGQILVGSFQATNRGEGRAAFLEDWKKSAELIAETGAKVVEMNLSCPNEGHGALLCYDTQTVVEALKKVREVMPTTPIILKTSYFQDELVLEKFIDAVIPLANGISAINTIAGTVRTESGEQALLGEGRLVSGVCGSPIKWAGLEMTKKLFSIRNRLSKPFTIIGCGGVMSVEDYQDYRNAGADAVMSATGAMWNPYLAKEIIAADNS